MGRVIYCLFFIRTIHSAQIYTEPQSNPYREAHMYAAAAPALVTYGTAKCARGGLSSPANRTRDNDIHKHARGSSEEHIQRNERENYTRSSARGWRYHDEYVRYCCLVSKFVTWRRLPPLSDDRLHITHILTWLRLVAGSSTSTVKAVEVGGRPVRRRCSVWRSLEET